MRKQVLDLVALGPMPKDAMSVEPEVVDKYQELLDAIDEPVRDEEAIALSKLFGGDDFFGLSWTLLHKIESAPGWPIDECLENTDNEWIRLLKQRFENKKRAELGN